MRGSDHSLNSHPSARDLEEPLYMDDTPGQKLREHEDPDAAQEEDGAEKPRQSQEYCQCCPKRFRCSRRDICAGSIGFVTALIIVGIGGLIVYKCVLTAGGSTSHNLVPWPTPRITSVRAAHAGWLEISWEGPAGAVYTIERREDSSSGRAETSTTRGVSATFSGLDAVRAYCFRVKAQSDHISLQHTDWSGSVCNVTSKVSPPGISVPPTIVATNSSLSVQAWPPQKVNGSFDDMGGDNNLSYWCKVVACTTQAPAPTPAPTIGHLCGQNSGDHCDQSCQAPNCSAHTKSGHACRHCPCGGAFSGHSCGWLDGDVIPRDPGLGCEPARTLRGTVVNGLEVCILDELPKYSSVTVWSYTSNSGGNSSLSGPLVCLNTSQLLPIDTQPNGVPDWSCSREAPPSVPTFHIHSHNDSVALTFSWSPSQTSSAEGLANYDVQVDDWWDHNEGNMSTIVKLASTATSFTLTGDKVLPGTVYHARVGAVDTSGHTSWSTTQASSTMDRGNCGNPSDLLQQRNQIGTMKKTIQGALLSCEFDAKREDCAANKISAAMQWSDACSRCWVEEGLCVQSSCLKDCLRPESDECDRCAKMHCFGPLEECTGLPEWTYPP